MTLLSLQRLVVIKSMAIVALLALLVAWEAWRPRRAVVEGWGRRLNNLGLIAVSTILVRLIVPMGAVGFAAAWHSGLWHQVAVPPVLQTGVSLVVLDLAIYWQHRAFHFWPLLWRAHRVHHSDIAFDASLGVRFHPFEILPSYAYKLLVVAIFGMAPMDVAIYEASLLGFSLLTHANAVLPASLDRVLRWIVITPDWHRVHHSIHRDEMNANFGNILSIWDRLFGTAREGPRDGHVAMAIGLPEFRAPQAQRFPALLIQPFMSTSVDTAPP